MITLNMLMPYLISFLTGYFIICNIIKHDKEFNPLLLGFLSLGIGLGINAYITFFTFIIFDELNKPAVFSINFLILFMLIFLKFMYSSNVSLKLTQPKNEIFKNILCITIILLGCIPLWYQAIAYPYGGWDAWSCWNLKSKFLFEGGEHWKNMFSPLLWRASPHYPLLLPLINVWGWLFIGQSSTMIPLLTSLIFTFLILGLLFSGIKQLTKNSLSLLPVLLLLTLPFFTQIATSQYSDIIVGYYLLASVICLTQSYQKECPSYALLAALNLGFLSFSKPEGAVAAIILFGLSIPFLGYLVLKKKIKGILKSFLIGSLFSFFPTVLFTLLYSPGNQTFINGLVSNTHPATFLRLKFVLMFFAAEFISAKWQGIWIILLIGAILAGKKCFNLSTLIVPLFLFFYIAILIFYYYLNTYFEISWWLVSTLNRILISLLPTFIFWVFSGVWQNYTKKQNGR